jgi:hypothetical protein
MLIDWYKTTYEVLEDLWKGFLTFLPKVIGAIVVFLIGWFLALAVGKLITEILKKIRFNQIFEKKTWKEALEKAEIKIDPAGFIGAIFKWILVIVFLLAAVDILGFVKFAEFLIRVLEYLPNVVVAAAIFVVVAIVADILEKIIRTTVEGMKIGYGNLLGLIVKWAIWIFGAIIILYQLGIAKPFMETLFLGIVALIVISFGLAFGLGGKEIAADLLRELQKRIKGEK